MAGSEKKFRASAPKVGACCPGLILGSLVSWTGREMKGLIQLTLTFFSAGKGEDRMRCMSRHVKCDERKPTCQRCEKAQWPCKYVLPAKKTSPRRTLVRPILPSRPAETSASSGEECGLNLFMSTLPNLKSENEHRYFRIFETRTAPELTGYFDSSIWNGLILQSCQREDFAWHAVVAIGALHKSLNTSQLWKSTTCPKELKSGDDGTTHHLFALQQYGKALNLMRRIPEQQEESRLQNSLISSLLTVCFESFLGNQQMALSQIRIGLDVLYSWPFACQLPDDDFSTMKVLAKSHLFLDEDLVGTFLLLDFQSMAFEGGATIRLMSKKYPEIPPIFESIREARMYLDVIVRRAQQWHSSVQTQRYPYVVMLDPDDPKSRTDENFEAEVELFHGTMRAWFHAFKPLFDRAQNKRGCKEYLSATALMARYTPSRFLFSGAEGGETKFDVYLPEFTSLVGLLEEVLGNDPNLKPGQATFIFGHHCVLALFVVGLRCRNPAIRRRAISLMVEHPRREGLWDSLMTAAIASWVMVEEEKGMVDGFVPESARLRVVKNDFLLSKREAVIRCSKQLADGSAKRVLLHEVTVTW